MSESSGGKRILNNTKYKKTADRYIYKGVKRVIYEGSRGAKYIKLKGKYISLSKIPKITIRKQINAANKLVASHILPSELPEVYRS